MAIDKDMKVTVSVLYNVIWSTVEGISCMD